LGSRRIEHVCLPDTAADLKRRGIDYVLVHRDFMERFFKCSLDDWLKRMNAQIVKKVPLTLRATLGTTDWYLVKLN
jgi:hypothetical protein